ncbi:hypothetical protein K439DRAFT_1619554 [Ramaria rubella]|nr:hypothetical protein K439DRAFT_1619554 [Ramaria rubella]
MQIKTITGDSANPVNSISLMRNLESAPQLPIPNISQGSAWAQEPHTPVCGVKRIRSPTQDGGSSQKWRMCSQLMMGSSPMLIGDIPPSKSTRSEKPSLVMEARMICSHTPNHSSAAIGSNGSQAHLPPAKYIPNVVVPTKSWTQTAKVLSDNALQTIRSKHKKTHRIAGRMTSEEYGEDNDGSLVDFIADNETNEDEASDIIDNCKVIPHSASKDIQEQYTDEDEEDFGCNATFPDQDQGDDIKEDSHIIASDSNDGHSMASMVLHQKKCKGKGKVIEDTDNNADSPGKYKPEIPGINNHIDKEDDIQEETSTPPPPVSLVLLQQNVKCLASPDEGDLNSETKLPTWKPVYHYVEMDKAIKVWHKDESQTCAVLKSKTPGTGTLYHNAPKFH